MTSLRLNTLWLTHPGEDVWFQMLMEKPGMLSAFWVPLLCSST